MPCLLTHPCSALAFPTNCRAGPARPASFRPTAGSLQPGALVAARVRSVLSDGLLVSFLTFFSGTVDPFHLGVELGVDWKKQFR